MKLAHTRIVDFDVKDCTAEEALKHLISAAQAPLLPATVKF